MVVLEFKRPAAPEPKTPAKVGKKVWHHPTKEYVRAEAAYEEEPYNGGPNVYTAYLKLYGRYPSPQQASAMGLNSAAECAPTTEKHYPPKSKAEKQHDKEARARRKEFARINDGVTSARYALHYLVWNGATFDEIIGYCVEDTFRDGAAIERDLDAGLEWLQRFAAAWRARHPVKQDV